MATLKDIAEMVGISVSAASLAIRDHDSISEETKRRVWGAQKKLGYQPNLARRSRPRNSEAAAQSTTDIAFVLSDRGFSDMLYARKFQAVTKLSVGHQFRPIYVSVKLADLHEGNFPSLLTDSGIKGIIVSGNYDEKAHQQLRRLKVPIVVSGNYSLGNESWSACEIDIAQGIRLMTDRMIELGHRRIALLVRSPGSHYAYDLECAYRRHAEMTKIEGGALVLREDSAHIQTQLDALLQQPDRPTALVLSTDGLALEVFDAADRLGLKIPRDLSITAFESGYHSLRPPLSVVSVDSNDIGRVTLRKLISQMQDPECLLTREVVGMRFSPGGSIAPPVH